MIEDSGSRLRRVLFALNLDSARKFGSLEEQILLLAQAFQRGSKQFIPVFCSGAEAATSEFLEAGVAIEHLDLREFTPGRLFRLAGLIRRHRAEVVHWNFYEPLKNPYLWPLSLLAPGVSHYFTDHISRGSLTALRRSPLKRAGKSLLYKRYEKVLCISDFVLNDLNGGIESNDSVQRCTYFINTDRFRPDPERRKALRAGVADDRFVILLVAQLRKEKGVAVALQALRELPPSAELWVVGEGEEMIPLQALQRELGLCDRVRFVGPQRHVESYMQAADCLVCPSLWAEAAGLVILEAQACGLPVVASRIGGIPEFIDEGKTGLLVPPGNAEALARALQLVQNDESTRVAMGAAAREFAVKRFAADTHLSDFLDFYRTPEMVVQHAQFARRTT